MYIANSTSFMELLCKTSNVHIAKPKILNETD